MRGGGGGQGEGKEGLGGEHFVGVGVGCGLECLDGMMDWKGCLVQVVRRSDDEMS